MLFFTWLSLLASDLLQSRMVGSQQVASAVGDLGAAALATALVTSKQTQRLYIQWSKRPSA